MRVDHAEHRQPPVRLPHDPAGERLGRAVELHVGLVAPRARRRRAAWPGRPPRPPAAVPAGPSRSPRRRGRTRRWAAYSSNSVRLTSSVRTTRRSGVNGVAAGADLGSDPAGRPAAGRPDQLPQQFAEPDRLGLRLFPDNGYYAVEWVNLRGGGPAVASGIGSVTSLVPSVHHNHPRRACQNFRATDEVVQAGTTGAPAERSATGGSCAAFAVDSP